MMRGLLIICLLVWTAIAQASDTWKNLWLTADQQGEQLMQQGKAKEAARIFSNPRRKAYAELQAKDYQHAAKDFETFNDSDGHYNRGNALAKAGQLQEAIKAYDAALAHDPKNEDARHNRELVAKALQKQPPQPKPSPTDKSSSNENKNTSNNQPGNKKDANKQADDKKSSTSKDTENNGQQNQNNRAKSNQDKADQSKNNNTNTKQKDANSGQKNANSEQKANQEQEQQAQENQPGQASKPNTQPQPGNDANEAKQAKQDAEAALNKLPAGQKAVSSNTPVSEKQLAQEQWLQRIPDDPGGLLRRKFMIEHMIRQQGTNP
ncbi:tetratricopeptide repeat protein [Sulfurirhabdus autotrophica]|uniref:Ca-activated chloride channel family protein n=1 Tax=Sulfurirhabdus autotrophica TaxID=1706046 RepID=A0A4V2W2U6_9PROT|nr:tetratricopeptide repeat protein [Sulfurirhabdus autotrophica]TCV89499.1 Ca-activated chloride channel family protein [Sulfurirhabdus autotrophica]